MATPDPVVDPNATPMGDDADGDTAATPPVTGDDAVDAPEGEEDGDKDKDDSTVDPAV